MRGTARPNCHILELSLGTPGNVPTAFMPAAERPHCSSYARYLKMLALGLACAVGQPIFGVY